MEVLIRDCDLLSLIVEFLHSRELFGSALALERESGCRSHKDELLHEDLKFLRQFVLDGKWERVLSFAEPLTYLEEFNSKAFHYLVLRQRYFEALHSNSLATNRSAQDIAYLKSTLEDVKPYCSHDEFQQLCLAHNHSVLHNWEVVPSRFKCFQSILRLVGPYYDEVDSTEVPSKTSDLQSLVIKALFYDECSKYHREKANSSNTEKPFLSTQSLNHTHNNNYFSADLFFWLRSISGSPHKTQGEEIQITVEKLNNCSTPHSNAPRQTSSPHSRSQGMIPKTLSPHSVAQSVNLPRSEQPHVQSNSLSSSGPAFHAQNSNRNRSNNNNNHAELAENASELVIHSAQKDCDVKERDNLRGSPQQIENPLSTRGLGQEHLGKNLGEDNAPQHQGHSSRVKLDSTPMQLSRKDGTNNSPKILDQQQQQPDAKVLRDSANIGQGALDQIPQSVKVQDSYEISQMEKQKVKLANQNFMKQLEEKEKEKDQIRRMLMDQTEDNAKNIALSPQANDQLVQQGDESTVDPPPVKVRYLPIEVTEDSASIRAVSFHPSGLVYSIGSNSKTLRICEVPRDTIARFIQETKNLSLTEGLENLTPKPSNVLIKRNRVHTGSIYSMAWNEEGSLLATCSNDKLIKLLSFDVLGKTLDENPQRMGFHRGVVREVQFLNGRGNILASAGGDGFVYITDCSKSANISQLPGHSDSILSLWAWKNDMVASSSQDKSIRLWDIRTSRCVSIIGVGTSKPGVPTSICVSSDGRILAMGLDNNNIGLYDLAGGKMLREYTAHANEVRSVRFNPVQNHLLLSSSYDGTIALTDVTGLLSDADPPKAVQECVTTIGKCDDKVIQCRWHPNGEDFASTSTDKTCKLWHRFGSSS